MACGLIVCLITSTAAFALNFRDSRLHHLTVKPGSNDARLVTTNVAEFVTQTGTNAFVVTTNLALLGTNSVGPRLALRIGTNIHFAVTNRVTCSTNPITGVLVTNTFRNGLLVEF